MAKHPPNPLFLISLAFAVLATASAQAPTEFIYNGFKGANISLDGIANIHRNGLLELTNQTEERTGHAFYPSPLKLSASPILSTTFAFAINPLLPKTKGYGLAFVISASKNMNNTSANVFLGLVNSTGNGDPSNHVFAVELDTSWNPPMKDIDGNHVGIDINSVMSVSAASASYYSLSTGITHTQLLAFPSKSNLDNLDYLALNPLYKLEICPAKRIIIFPLRVNFENHLHGIYCGRDENLAFPDIKIPPELCVSCDFALDLRSSLSH